MKYQSNAFMNILHVNKISSDFEGNFGRLYSGFYFIYLFRFAARAGPPQQCELITVEPYHLTYPVGGNRLNQSIIVLPIINQMSFLICILELDGISSCYNLLHYGLRSLGGQSSLILIFK